MENIDLKRKKMRDYMRKYWAEHPEYRKAQNERIKEWRKTPDGVSYLKLMRESESYKNYQKEYRRRLREKCKEENL